MAPIWWDKNGVQKALHDINVLRVDYINKHAPLAGKRIVSGCGLRRRDFIRSHGCSRELM